MARTVAPRTSADFIEEMQRLRTAGRDTEAAATLAAFRAAYPDADNRLPADLRLWAMRVSR